MTLVMSFIATRRRFGRYVYAYGGNPDAAELAGINTRWTILKTYVLMGVLCALAAAIAAARLNGATLDVGQSYELYVIAAAVVGGTSFAGGIGTIPGAVLGAFVMQSLAYGLSFIGVNSPGQNVVAGIVLILAVGFDTFNRRRGLVSGRRTDHDRRSSEPRSSRCATSTSPSAASTPCATSPSTCTPARSSASSAATAPASRPSCGCCRARIRPTAARSWSTASRSRSATRATPRRCNIETIYQTLALADNIDAPGNLFLGRELTTRLGSLDDSSMESETRKIMGRLNPNFTRFAQPVKSLSGGQRQAVAIARAVYFNARILIMDEPTAALGPAETAQVRNLVRQLKDEGIGIFLISHDIHDVFDLSDRISVMYHGRIVDTVDKAEVTADDVLGMIILGKKPGRGHREGHGRDRAPRLSRAGPAALRPVERRRQRRVERPEAGMSRPVGLDAGARAGDGRDR